MRFCLGLTLPIERFVWQRFQLVCLEAVHLDLLSRRIVQLGIVHLDWLSRRIVQIGIVQIGIVHLEWLSRLLLQLGADCKLKKTLQTVTRLKRLETVPAETTFLF